STFVSQAEDGIRDRNVTGVQTCALPIYILRPKAMMLRSIYFILSKLTYHIKAITNDYNKRLIRIILILAKLTFREVYARKDKCSKPPISDLSILKIYARFKLNRVTAFLFLIL